MPAGQKLQQKQRSGAGQRPGCCQFRTKLGGYHFMMISSADQDDLTSCLVQERLSVCDNSTYLGLPRG